MKTSNLIFEICYIICLCTLFVYDEVKLIMHKSSFSPVEWMYIGGLRKRIDLRNPSIEVVYLYLFFQVEEGRGFNKVRW
jgi:hypothetical protein